MPGATRPISKAGPDAKKIFLKMGSALVQDRQKVIIKAATAAKAIHVAELKKATSTMRLRNVGKNGARVGIMYRSKPVGYAMAEGLVTATGKAFPIIERKLKPHTIYAGSKGGRDVAPVAPYGFFPQVKHPGVRNPKKPFEKGYVKAKPVISRTIRGRAYKTIIANGRL